MKKRIFNRQFHAFHPVARRAWHVYSGLCAALVTFAVLFFCAMAGYNSFRYIAFPNETRLVPVGWDWHDEQEYDLENSHGVTLVARVSELALQNEYVFGNAYNEKTHSTTYFIYKKGWPDAKAYHARSEYRHSLDIYGLGDTIQIPAAFEQESAYRLCADRLKLQCKMEWMDRYRMRLEEGKSEPYQKESADQTIPMFMSKYRSVEDWNTLPRYRKHWLE